MEPRSFGAAWSATMAFITANSGLLIPLAGALLFLPGLVFQFGLDEYQPGQPVPEQLRLRFAVLLALLITASVLAQLTITRLATEEDRGRTLGDHLAISLATLVPAIAAFMMQSIAIGFGLVLLIIPGIYLIGRLLFVVPLLASETRDPIEALKRSWALTEGNGFRLASFILFLGFGIIAISVMLGGLGAAIGVISTVATGSAPEQGWGMGRWLFELLNAGVSALLSVVSMVFIAQLYRAFRTGRN